VEKDTLYFRGWVDYHFGKISPGLPARPSGRGSAKMKEWWKLMVCKISAAGFLFTA